jgi:hypothetical protein
LILHSFGTSERGARRLTGHDAAAALARAPMVSQPAGSVKGIARARQIGSRTLHRAEPWPGFGSLIDGELLTQGEVLERELAMAAEEEREEAEQVKCEGDLEPRLWSDQGDRSTDQPLAERMAFWRGTGEQKPRKPGCRDGPS